MDFLISLPRGELAGLIDEKGVLEKAYRAYRSRIECIPDFPAPLSEGGANDYFSCGDYWWPNPDEPDGLPYVRRDGRRNPDLFQEHRRLLRAVRTKAVNLAAGYALEGNEKYAEKGAEFLHKFFLDGRTKMNPGLEYGQAVPGVCPGRGIGVIDTLHLIGIPPAVDVLGRSGKFPLSVVRGLKEWFSEYLGWMMTHPYGIEEMNAPNNHGICWVVQAGVFARFTGDEKAVEFCVNRYKEALLPDMMSDDGSFPAELGRTKPYAYSIFALDNMANICHILSTKKDNLWEFNLSDGRGIGRGFEFLYPYLADRNKWPYGRDIEGFDAWPAGIASLLFAGLGLNEPRYMELWRQLDPEPDNAEARRNMAIRRPMLWLLKNNRQRRLRKQD